MFLISIFLPLVCIYNGQNQKPLCQYKSCELHYDCTYHRAELNEKHCEGGGGDEESNINVLMNWEDDIISVSLGASAGDLRVKRV